MSQPKTYAEVRSQWFCHMLPNIPVPDDRVNAHQIVRDALERLHAIVRTIDDGRGVDIAITDGRGDPAITQYRADVTALIAVARTVRDTRGPGSQHLEAAVLRTLVEIADEHVLPFLIESFRFSRPHDGSAGHRRTIVLTGIVTIAVLHGHAEARACVDDALVSPTPRIRLAACRAITDVVGMAGIPLPPSLMARLDEVAHHDRAPDVWVSARLALEAAATPWRGDVRCSTGDADRGS